MRLLDQVAQETRPITVESSSLGRLVLPGANVLSASVKQTSLKYVLQDDVVDAVNSLVFQQPGLIYSCRDIIRAPAETLWLEWHAAVGAAEVQVNGRANVDRRKMGALVNSESGGKRGTIQIVWAGEAGKADPSPALILFDLEQEFSRKSNPYQFSFVNDDYQLGNIMRHTTIEIQPDWLKYYQAAAPHGMNKIVRDLATAIIFDPPFVFGFFLLMAARSQLSYQPSDLDRLNAQRSKGKKPLLMDYVEIGTVLHRIDRNERATMLDQTRSASRLHHVRGHFVRRGTHIFWRSPHLRGNPQIGKMPDQVRRISL